MEKTLAQEKAESYFREKATVTGVPVHLIDGIIRYIVHGIEPGSCLVAIFANDLMEAFGRADQYTAAGMGQICTFIYSYAPSASHGSYKRVGDWMVAVVKAQEEA
jgi:hypothetical protein